jgi:hypothetical protein
MNKIRLVLHQHAQDFLELTQEHGDMVSFTMSEGYTNIKYSDCTEVYIPNHNIECIVDYTYTQRKPLKKNKKK